MHRSALTVALAAVLSVLTVVPGQAANVVTVTSGNMQGWLFYNDEADQVDNSLGSFVTGPGTAPLGAGSAQISVTGTQRRNLATYQFAGTALSDITELKYSTYTPAATSGGADRAAFLNINVDFNGSDTWQRRLVFVPRNNGTVLTDAWQEWDTIKGGAALWGYSGAAWPGTATPGTTTRTWADIKASYPGVRIRVTDAHVGLRVGEPYNNGYTGNIDAFKFTAGSRSVQFDFEPTIGPPTSKDDCKDGGWRRFNTPAFKNQGDCVSSVTSGR